MKRRIEASPSAKLAGLKVWFDKDDLAVWAANTIMQIKWPVTLVAAWTELLCADADTGAGLDIGMVYEAMDRSIKEIRFDAEGFRRKLENRMSR